MDFGSNLRAIRKANALTQKELGQKIGVTSQAVCKWESNQNKPDMITTAKLCLALGCTLDDLTGYETRPISDKERELIVLFRKVSPDVQDVVFTILKTKADLGETFARGLENGNSKER